MLQPSFLLSAISGLLLVASLLLETKPSFPAAGSLNSSVEVTPARLAALVSRRWVDACRLRGSD